MKSVERGIAIIGLVALFVLGFTGASEAQNYNWTGFYLGANAGYASGSSDSTSELCSANFPACLSNPPVTQQINNQWSPTLHPNGFTGGMQAGYNWQWKNLVLGVETDVNSFVTADERTTATSIQGGGNAFTVRSKVNTDWLVTFRPRIGWAQDNWLFYVTGGLALTDMHARWQFHDQFNEDINATAEATKAGGVVGGGIEIGLTKNLSFKGEFLYMSFGGISTNGILTAGVPPVQIPLSTFHSMNLSSALGRVGLNWRF